MMAPILPTGLCFDLECVTDKVIFSWADSFGETAWNFLAGAFTGDASYIDTEEFSVAAMMTNSVAGVMAIILIVLGSIQLILDIRKGGIGAALKTFFGILMAWPVTAVSVWMTMKLTRYVDQLSNAILGTDSGSQALAKVFTPAMTNPSLTNKAAMYLVFMLIIWLLSLVLSLIMIIRNFVLLALIAIAPMALMILPASFARTWSKNWAGAVLATLLIKPLSAIILVLAAELTAKTEGFTAVLTGIVGLILAAASPLLASKIFGFAGLQAADSATSAAGQSVSSARSTVSQTHQMAASSAMRKGQMMNRNMESRNSVTGAGVSSVQSSGDKFAHANSKNADSPGTSTSSNAAQQPTTTTNSGSKNHQGAATSSSSTSAPANAPVQAPATPTKSLAGVGSASTSAHAGENTLSQATASGSQTSHAASAPSSSAFDPATGKTSASSGDTARTVPGVLPVNSGAQSAPSAAQTSDSRQANVPGLLPTTTGRIGSQIPAQPAGPAVQALSHTTPHQARGTKG